MLEIDKVLRSPKTIRLAKVLKMSPESLVDAFKSAGWFEDSPRVRARTRTPVRESEIPPLKGGSLTQALSPEWESWWERFLSVYPSRDGDRGVSPGKAKFRLRFRDGFDPDDMVRGAEGYRSHCRSRGIEGTSFVKRIPAFLNQETWKEYLAPAQGPNPSAGPSAVITRPIFQEEA